MDARRRLMVPKDLLSSGLHSGQIDVLPGRSRWTAPVLEEKNDEDDEFNSDGAPLKVNDLRRRTGNGRPTLRRGKGGMSWSNDLLIVD